METSLKIHEQLSRAELDIQNLTMFISQSMDILKCKMCEYQHWQRELYVRDGIEKAQQFVNSLG